MATLCRTYQLSGPRRAFAPRFTPCSVKDGDISRSPPSTGNRNGLKERRNGATKLATLGELGELAREKGRK